MPELELALKQNEQLDNIANQNTQLDNSESIQSLDDEISNEDNAEQSAESTQDEDSLEENIEDNTEGNSDYRIKHFRKQNRRDKKEIKRLNQEKLTLVQENTQLKELFNQFLSQSSTQNQQNSSTLPQNQNSVSVQEPIDEVERKVNEVLAKKAQEEQQKQIQMQIAHKKAEFIKELHDASDRYEDFEEVIKDDELPFTQTMADAIQYLPKENNYRTDFLYSLAKNKEEVKRISKLPPDEQVRALIARVLNINSSQSKLSKAPPPAKSNVKSIPTSTVRDLSQYHIAKQWVKEKSRR